MDISLFKEDGGVIFNGDDSDRSQLFYYVENKLLMSGYKLTHFYDREIKNIHELQILISDINVFQYKLSFLLENDKISQEFAYKVDDSILNVTFPNPQYDFV